MICFARGCPNLLAGRSNHAMQARRAARTTRTLGIAGTGVGAMKRIVGSLSAALLLSACASKETRVGHDLTDLGTRYAAAWSSQNPAQLASFYAENGSLIVNGGPPATGRTAIAAKAHSFMTAFPDMVVMLERMDRQGDHPVFRWIWTGTNTGPGGTGQFVRIIGYEVWTLDSNGLIAKCDGHYDEAEYQRQLKLGAPPQPLR